MRWESSITHLPPHRQPDKPGQQPDHRDHGNDGDDVDGRPGDVLDHLALLAKVPRRTSRRELPDGFIGSRDIILVCHRGVHPILGSHYEHIFFGRQI